MNYDVRSFFLFRFRTILWSIMDSAGVELADCLKLFIDASMFSVQNIFGSKFMSLFYFLVLFNVGFNFITLIRSFVSFSH